MSGSMKPGRKTISIHALREEGDVRKTGGVKSVGGISIHALREEGDGHKVYAQVPTEDISIHALREEGDP